MRQRSLSLWAVSFAVLAAGGFEPLNAADVLPTVRDRFHTADVKEVPDFQMHIVPLMGRLGCNGRACHGSFQGQGGFRLSLFGYDFDFDHEGLMDRIDTDDPRESYALHKGTEIESHEGGKRMDPESWEYNVFLRWIEGGAKGIETPTQLERLEVTPSEVQFAAKEQTQQLRVIAHWAGGVQEDVTPLCRFQSNDDAVCAIDTEGLVTAGDVGDSHIVVFYDQAVVPIPVIRPVSRETRDHYPDLAAKTEIDRHVVNKLQKLGIIPSDVCDDAEFLRRVNLDLAGTLPSPAEARAFLADPSPEKRARKIDELLETPAYAAWWTTQMCDWTGCSDQQLQNVNPANRSKGSADWYEWINHRIANNVPYDDIVEGIVVASSREPGESYRDYCERMSSYAHREDASFADQKGLVYYWGRRDFSKSEERAIGFAYTFMGTRIQCAQCHKHPFDVWTQQDFEQFESFFDRVTFARTGSDRDEFKAITEELGVADLKGNDQRRAIEKALKEGKTIPFPELTIRAPRATEAMRKKAELARKQGKEVEIPQELARLLGDQEVDLAEIADPRTALMDWLRHSPTKLFAKAFVNRVWANYFNRGIVEPTDDLSMANPPCNEELFNYLVNGFIDHDYDIKWLHREICLSDTYQRSWRPNETNVQDERNFSRAVPRRLPAEVAYDALLMATANDKRAATFATDLDGRATIRTSPPRRASTGPDYALAIFGRSARESNCDCDRSSEASLLQTLFTRNDQDTQAMLERRDSWVDQWSRELKADSADHSKASRKKKLAEQRLERLQKSLARAKKSGVKKQIANLESQLQKAQEELQPVLDAVPVKQQHVDVTKIVEEAYLRTVSRFPSDTERELAAGYLSDSPDTLSGIKDLMWALINTKEFMVNH